MNFTAAKNKTVYILRLLFVAAVTGAICGFTGALFSKSIAFVTELRANYPWLIFLLPVGGLAIIGIYKLCKSEGKSTKTVLDSVHGNGQVSAGLLPSIFTGTVIGHFLGASVGREGAALQIGGSISAVISKWFGNDEQSSRILTVCGMGATFSAVFGTPLGACVFAIEVIRNLKFGFLSFFPTLISSLTAYGIAYLMGAPAERFELLSVPAFEFSVLWRVIVVAVATGILGFIFCHLLNISEHYTSKLIKNPYIRIFAGGVIIILLTMITKTTDYNGGGIFVVERVLETSSVIPFAFLLKILFTVISDACGYKGGEIVPSFFIGATFGAVIAGLIGLPVPFGATVGMAAIFGAVTNCPVATCFICAEAIGIEGLPFFIIAAISGNVVSGKISLFHSASHEKSE